MKKSSAETSASNPRIRVLLVDDHPMVRNGLRDWIGRVDGADVVGEAGDGHEAVRLARQLKPDIVVMDVVLPKLNGIEATRRIVSSLPATKVIAVSGYVDTCRVTEALRAGALAFMPKECTRREIAGAIRSATAGHRYLSPGVDRVLDWECLKRPEGSGSSAFDMLTSREREVVQMLAEGFSAKGIADELGLSEKTIEMHRRRILKKLGLSSVAELGAYAVRECLTESK